MSEGRKDFSVNGDVVARAIDLEAKTKGTTSKILLSKASIQELNRDNVLIYKDFDKEAVELIDVKE